MVTAITTVATVTAVAAMALNTTAIVVMVTIATASYLFQFCIAEIDEFSDLFRNDHAFTYSIHWKFSFRCTS
jgi:hypothetical protein